MARSARSGKSADSSSRLKGQAGDPSPRRREARGGGSRRPIFRFVATFVLLLGLFYLLYFLVSQTSAYKGYLAFLARGSAVPLNLIGHDVTVRGTWLSTDTFTVQVVPGCDATEALGVFLAAVLASPVRWMLKFLALVAGPLLILLINFVRIASLLLVGGWSPRAFDMIHIDVWQPLFVLLAFGLWIGWAIWAFQYRGRKLAIANHHAAIPGD